MLKNVVALVCLVGVVGAVTGCSIGSKTKGKSRKSSHRVSAIAPHLEFYGYYRDSDIEECMPEVMDHANMTYVQFKRLPLAKALGMKAIVGGPFDEELDEFVSFVAPYVADGTAIAVHLADEPDFRRAGEKEKLAAVITRMHEKVPGLPVIMTHFQPGMIKEFLQEYPGLLDWVGYDCYRGGGICRQDVAEIAAMLGGNQRIVILPNGSEFATPKVPFSLFGQNFAYSEEEQVEVMDEGLQAAINEPKVIGMMAFHWQGEGEYYGLRDRPLALAKSIEMGNAITGGSRSSYIAGKGPQGDCHQNDRTPAKYREVASLPPGAIDVLNARGGTQYAGGTPAGSSSAPGVIVVPPSAGGGTAAPVVPMSSPAVSSSCPVTVVAGVRVDGDSVCSPWEFNSCLSNAGYVRVRSCPAASGCRTRDENGPDTPLNIGGSVRPRCAPIPHTQNWQRIR